MHDLGDDNELDHISREAAGKYSTPGTANWQQMEAALDKALPVEKKRRFFLFWLLPVILAVGAGYWLVSSPDKTTTIATQTQTAHSSSATVVQDKPAAPVQNTVIADKLNNRKPMAGNENSKITQDVPARTSVRKMVTFREPATTPVAASATPLPETPNPAGSFTSPQVTSTNNTTTASETATVPAGSAAQANGPTTVSATPTPEPNNQEKAAAPDEQKNDPVVTTSLPKAILPALGKGLSIGLVAGFDKSTVRFNYGNEPGINIGLLIGYHFGKRWSLHTGAVFTQKNYKMAGSDFHAPKGSWASYYKLETVTGYCRMWELPLLARYGFAQSGRNQYFVSTGLSSYFMTSEDYSYFYYQQGVPTTRHASYGPGASHIFSIAHISAGFENRLSKNLVLQVEPYAKLPLQGVGLGSIQLSSFGVNFGLQLRQPSKR